jgi:hypothetical protein
MRSNASAGIVGSVRDIWTSFGAMIEQRTAARVTT